MVRVLIVEDQKIMQRYFEYILCKIRNFDMLIRLQMQRKQ